MPTKPKFDPAMFAAVKADAAKAEARRQAAAPKPPRVPVMVPKAVTKPVVTVKSPVAVKPAPAAPKAPMLKVDPLAASRAAFLAGLLRAKMPEATARKIADGMTAADLLPTADARRKARRHGR